MIVSILAAALFLLTLIELRINWSLGWSRPSPASHTMPEGDLASLWMAGHLARLGQLDWLYNSQLFEAWRQQRFGASLRGKPRVYPPTVLLIGVPLSFLPLLPVFLVWDGTTLALAVLLLRRARVPWPILIVGLAAPATWRVLVLGPQLAGDRRGRCHVRRHGPGGRSGVRRPGLDAVPHPIRAGDPGAA